MMKTLNQNTEDRVSADAVDENEAEEPPTEVFQT